MSYLYVGSNFNIFGEKWHNTRLFRLITVRKKKISMEVTFYHVRKIWYFIRNRWSQIASVYLKENVPYSLIM